MTINFAGPAFGAQSFVRTAAQPTSSTNKATSSFTNSNSDVFFGKTSRAKKKAPWIAALALAGLPLITGCNGGDVAHAEGGQAAPASSSAPAHPSSAAPASSSASTTCPSIAPAIQAYLKAKGLDNPDTSSLKTSSSFSDDDKKLPAALLQSLKSKNLVPQNFEAFFAKPGDDVKGTTAPDVPNPPIRLGYVQTNGKTTYTYFVVDLSSITDESSFVKAEAQIASAAKYMGDYSKIDDILNNRLDKKLPSLQTLFEQEKAKLDPTNCLHIS